jgi:hypothetical protein
MLVAIDPETGQLMVNDCQSTNGIKVNNKFVEQAHLTSNDIIKIGRTRLRIIDTKVAMPHSIHLSELEENLSWLNRASLGIVLTLLYMAYLISGKYIASVEEFTLLKALPSELGKLALFSLWPLSFAVLAKVVKKESHIINQFNLTLLLILIVSLLSLVKQVIVFNLHPGDWFTVISFFVLSSLAIGFIWLSLFIAFHQQSGRRNTIALMLAFVLLAPTFIFEFIHNEQFSRRPDYSTVLLPPMYNITPAINSQQFVHSSKELFNHVDKLKNE